ncbi:MAG: nicotinamide-nucleotide adenylyltransferase [Desulfurococcales archaeon]|nr:nicotinamide-nucleotide adenylyltransferase [Desulfurococcales archaeon]
MKRRAMIFGRFQPLHLGHIELFKWTLARGFDEIAVLVGMASENYTPQNPFTAGERIEMIRIAAETTGIGLDKIITSAIPTLETNIGCTYYVLSYVPKIEAIVTRNPTIARIFKDAGYKVLTPPLFDREKYRATHIRRLIAQNNPEWRRLVPPGVAEYIEEIGGVDRIRDIMSSD